MCIFGQIVIFVGQKHKSRVNTRSKNAPMSLQLNRHYAKRLKLITFVRFLFRVIKNGASALNEDGNFSFSGSSARAGPAAQKEPSVTWRHHLRRNPEQLNGPFGGSQDTEAE